jgi:hypothetical protein
VGIERRVPTREQVLALLESGDSYESAAARLHIPAGLAFMIATGLPADGSDALPTEELEPRSAGAGSSQHLVNPPAHNPTRKEHVLAWVEMRAARDLKAKP